MHLKLTLVQASKDAWRVPTLLRISANHQFRHQKIAGVCGAMKLWRDAEGGSDSSARAHDHDQQLSSAASTLRDMASRREILFVYTNLEEGSGIGRRH
jgi:hypothetical protein